MSGQFGSLGGIIEIMFNSRRGNSYMPGGGCCNNNFGFGNIWGGNCGAMMPFANTYNPFGFNNMGSMFMPQLGGYNPYCGSQFGGYGEFDNSGSQFGAYAQFGGSDYGCHHENNGFGKLLGLLGVGLLGYGVGHSEGKTFGDKFSNFINTLFGNKTKKDSADKPAEPEPKINIDSDKAAGPEPKKNIDSDKVKDANANTAASAGTNSNANTGADPTKNTQTKAEPVTEKNKKADNNADNASKEKSGEAGQPVVTTKVKENKEVTTNIKKADEKKVEINAAKKTKTAHTTLNKKHITTNNKTKKDDSKITHTKTFRCNVSEW